MAIWPPRHLLRSGIDGLLLPPLFADAAPGEDQFVIPIGVNSKITSEQDYTVQFRVLQTTTPGSERASVEKNVISRIATINVWKYIPFCQISHNLRVRLK